jgi:hypothetical protein
MVVDRQNLRLLFFFGGGYVVSRLLRTRGGRAAPR